VITPKTLPTALCDEEEAVNINGVSRMPMSLSYGMPSAQNKEPPDMVLLLATCVVDNAHAYNSVYILPLLWWKHQ